MSAIAKEDRFDTSAPLVPRLSKQGFAKEDMDRRREWLQVCAGTTLKHIGACSINSRTMKGNIENPIGAAQIPLGVAGPLLVVGEHARGVFYVPLATTEGALVRSYERGMTAITRAGGAIVRITSTGNRACPLFSFDGIEQAYDFATELPAHLAQIKAIAASTTNHGKLVSLFTRPIGRDVVVDLQFDTADAHGMNMICKATEAVCKWIVQQFDVATYYVLTGGSSEKRASATLFRGGKGRQVTAGLRIPANIVQSYLHTTPARFRHMWQRTLLAQLQAGTIGYNGHYANGLTAMFIACGQDVANVVNCAVGITNFDVTNDNSLFASVTLPSLTIGTVGGGTALGTSRECLNVLGCYGTGKAPKFAEVIAATLLAGELSFGAALASGDFVNAHEKYGRNRPVDREIEDLPPASN
jgi:hydroxymethylglutaryl-CoA reductase (NADPH)